MPKVRFTERAHDLLSDLPPKAQERIKEALRASRDCPERQLRPMTGYDYWSVRTGDYRTIVDWDRAADMITVVDVGHRRNVYDRFSE